MRRSITMMVAVPFTLVVASTVPAVGMEPPGGGAQDNFGCVNGKDDAVGGHPGANGLTHATPKVGRLTGDSMPTAWNAVEHAGPIDFGSC